MNELLTMFTVVNKLSNLNCCYTIQCQIAVSQIVSKPLTIPCYNPFQTILSDIQLQRLVGPAHLVEDIKDVTR